MISLVLGLQENCDKHCNFIPMQELRIMLYRLDLSKVRYTCYLLLLQCYLFYYFLHIIFASTHHSTLSFFCVADDSC